MGEGQTERLAELLSRGLDLCVRARKLDAQQRTNDLAESAEGVNLERFAARANAVDPVRPYMTRSATIPLWVQDQYERDLAAWEAEAKAALMQTPGLSFIGNAPADRRETP